ncbi:hypothetical protein O3M35_000540 [Rhynocoris fuscipes]|uniref:Uncharacterized protein n=1 Tax=Rhynocoris fuscipes TaxID=488301 RepID=A0AAW1DM42_9HEMI
MSDRETEKEKDIAQSSAEDADKEVQKEVSEECSCDPECHQELLSGAFQEEEGQSNKKRKPRASKITKAIFVSTPKKEVQEKKSRVKESKTEEPMSEINFKNLKGLAVFAKWPNSGCYYPGIIEGLDNSDS